MDFVSWVNVVLPLVLAVIGFVTAYLKHKEAGDNEELARYHRGAFNAVSGLVYQLSINAKDSSISEEQFQAMVNNVTAELQKLREKPEP